MADADPHQLDAVTTSAAADDGNDDVVDAGDGLSLGEKAAVPKSFLPCITMIHPENGKKMLWDVFVILLVIYNAVYIPIDIALNPKKSGGQVAGDIIVDYLFALDIVASLCTGFFHDVDGVPTLEMDPKTARANYLAAPKIIKSKFEDEGYIFVLPGWFWLDFPATFPFENVVDIINLIGGKGTLVVNLGMLGALKAIRLLRLGRMLKMLDKLPSAGGIRISLLLFWFTLLAHLMGCLYLIIGGGTENFVETNVSGGVPWVHRHKLNPLNFSDDAVTIAGSRFLDIDVPASGEVYDAENPQVWYIYLYSLQWAVSSLCFTYPNLQPTTDAERAFVSIEQLVAIMIFSSVFANIMSLLSSMGGSSKIFRESMDAINEVIGRNQVPGLLAQKMRDYVELNVASHHKNTQNYPVCAELPPLLVTRAKYFQYYETLRTCSLFATGVFSNKNVMDRDEVTVSGKKGKATVTLGKGSEPLDVTWVSQDTASHGDTCMVAAVDEHWRGTVKLSNGAEFQNPSTLDDTRKLFLEHLVHRFQWRAILKGDFLVRRGEVNGDLFIIAEDGKMELLAEDGATVAAVFKEGDYFSFFDKQGGCDSVRAEENCNLLVLPMDGHRSLVDEGFQDDVDKLFGIVREKMEDTLASLDTLVFNMKKDLKHKDLYTFQDKQGSGDADDEELRTKGTIHPNSPTKEKWDWFIIIFVMYNAIWVPVELGFAPATPPGLETFDTFVDICFMIDLYLSFRTGYEDNSGRKPVIILDRVKARNNYLKGWFLLDFPATFPWEWVFILFAIKTSTSFLKLLKVPRLLRLGRLLKKLEKIQAANLLRIAKMTIGFFLCAHIFACIYYIIGTNSANEKVPGIEWPAYQNIRGGWCYFNDSLPEEEALQCPDDCMPALVQSLYWAVASLIKSPPFRPHTPYELLFTTFTMLCGILMLANVAGTMGAVAKSMNKSSEHRSNMALINAFSDKVMLPQDLQDRMQAFAEVAFSLKFKRVTDEPLVTQLPEYLQTQLLVHSNMKVLERCKVFEPYHNRDKGTAQFIKAVSASMRYKLVMKKELVTRSGEPCTDLMFVPEEGKVQYNNAGNDVTAAKVQYKEFDIFGMHDAECRAMDDIDLVVVPGEAVSALQKKYETEMTDFWKYVEIRKQQPLRKFGEEQVVPLAPASEVVFDEKGNVEERKLLRRTSSVSEAKIAEEEELHKNIIDPEATWKQVWDMFIIILVLYNSTYVPFEVCFGAHLVQKSSGQDVFDIIVDICFAIDIGLSFRTAYPIVVKGKEKLIKDPSKIRKNYFAFWFPIDLVATFPWELLILLFGGGEDMSWSGMLKTPRLLRLGRLLKKVDKLRNASGLLIFLTIFTFVVIAHWTACIYFVVGTSAGNAQEQLDGLGMIWPEANLIAFRDNVTGLFSPDDLDALYLSSFFWALTSLLKNPIYPPGTDTETWFYIFAQVFGLIVFAGILGAIIGLLQQMEARMAVFRAKMARINALSAANKWPKSLEKQVVEYVEFIHDNDQKIMHPGTVLDKMPVYLKEDIVMKQFQDIVFGTVAKGAPRPGEEDDPDTALVIGDKQPDHSVPKCRFFDPIRDFELVVRSVVLKMHFKPILEDDQVFLDSTDCVFMIAEDSRLKIVDEFDNDLAILHEGDCFGCNKGTGVAYSVFAQENLDVCEINARDLAELEKRFPEHIAEAKANVRQGVKDLMSRKKVTRRQSSLLQGRKHSSSRVLMQSYVSFNRESGDKTEVDPEVQKIDIRDDMSDFSRKFMFPPTSQFKENWDWLIIGFVLYNAAYIPIEISFVGMTKTAGHAAFDWFVDSMFAIDIVLSYLSMYEDTSGKKIEIVHDYKRITQRYMYFDPLFRKLPGWFWLDFPATFPFAEVAVLFMGDGDAAEAAGMLGLLKAFRLLRLGRLLKKLDKMKAANALRLGKIFFGFMLVAHVLGCLFFAVGAQASLVANGTSWIVYNQNFSLPYDIHNATNIDDNFGTLYLSSLYWAISSLLKMPCFVPMNNDERLFACFVQVVGVCINASIFANMIAIITASDAGANIKRIKTEQANDFIFKNFLHLQAPHIASLMRDYVFNNHQVGHKRFLEDPLVENIPQWLRLQLAEYQHARFIKANQFFNLTSPEGQNALAPEKWVSEEFRQALVLCLKWKMCLKNDLLLHRDYPCKEVFFVPEELEMHELAPGQDLDKITEEQGHMKVAKVFHEFTAFGLVDQVSVVAPNDTDLRWITVEDCQMLNENFPEQWDRLRSYVVECMADDKCKSNRTPTREWDVADVTSDTAEAEL